MSWNSWNVLCVFVSLNGFLFVLGGLPTFISIGIVIALAVVITALQEVAAHGITSGSWRSRTPGQLRMRSRSPRRRWLERRA